MTRTTDELLPPIAYSTPNWLTQRSAWVMHIPFAFTLVEALRPRTVVELGVHAGDSYAAWCQAVDALALESRCYGIDTWEGDAHAGAYDGPALLSALRGHHDPRYGRFSQLLRATFDQALEHADDASIDLLHIDGFHTYDAVSHDFESWSPKLSDRAVVLFHDINVREGDFGVHRYWSEIMSQYPSFEFLFGHGLGVIGVGSDLPDAVRVLFELGQVERENLGRMLAALGERASLLSGYCCIDEDARRRGWSLDLEYFGRRTVENIAGLHDELETERSTRKALELSERQLDDTIIDLRHQLVDLRRQLGVAMDARDEAHRRIEDFARSTSWRITAPLRRVRRLQQGDPVSDGEAPDDGPLAGGSVSADIPATRPISTSAYMRWFDRYGHLPRAQGIAARGIEDGPLISVVMPVYMPDIRFLRRATESVISQSYERWELCIADDASTDPDVRRYLGELAEADDRIHLILRAENGHISACSNSALRLATGDYVALVDQDDELASDALLLMAVEIAENSNIDILYSDEDKIDEAGRHYEPYFKSDFDPVLLLGQNFVSHLGVYRRELIEEVGGFREGFEGSQDHDLLLRCLARSDRDRVVHVPHVLYHWRALEGSTARNVDEKPYAAEAARRAVSEYLAEAGIDGAVVPGPGGYQRFRPALTTYPTVTIVIPTKNGYDLLRSCVESIRFKTTYPAYDILIVDNGSDDPATVGYLADLAGLQGVAIRRDPGPFNYSRINNAAVEAAMGEFVVLLNNDTEIIAPEWLDELVAWGLQPDVGSVGCMLLYSDDTIQHAGVVLGLGGVAGHPFRGLPCDTTAYFAHPSLAREVSCSTAACLLIRRETFLSVGGLDEDNLAVAFNDVDLGLRLREMGLRNIWTPDAVLYHHESKTRGRDDRPSRINGFVHETDYMRLRWATWLEDDPYYNPNLGLDAPGHDLAFPPRTRMAPVRLA